MANPEPEWLLKKNCSLSPRQVGVAYGALCGALAVIGLAFALRGAWFVFGFVALDIAVLVAALLCYARHAGDRELVAFSEGGLIVERVEAGRLERIRLDACWTRIVMPDRRRSLIALESRGVTVRIGGFVGEEIRRQVALELRRELRSRALLR
ncbi:DUF2244 domain-containing protein [Massilia atriviolacea]|uniref:DUF2244 domain-containing protein n=1 Tax=Massilia atriviolacea TaxID=2495579 RepID=A0A430HU03_9BURK|nr:DUF2244 domain-containing protein [Massilia atriviolacea]RSZ61051.1 DUF2244 domain-containing protein [Massilia atriviolacea]